MCSECMAPWRPQTALPSSVWYAFNQHCLGANHDDGAFFSIMFQKNQRDARRCASDAVLRLHGKNIRPQHKLCLTRDNASFSVMLLTTVIGVCVCVCVCVCVSQ